MSKSNMRIKAGTCIDCGHNSLYFYSSSLCCNCHVKRSTRYHTQEYRFRKRGVTREWYEQEASKGCAICQKPLCAQSAVKRERGHIDHDHITGVTRGVLCDLCNKGLGQFQDNIQTLEAAIKYLKRFKHD